MKKLGNNTFFIEKSAISPREGLLTRDNETLRLEPRAMEVLVYLASRPNEVVTREELEKEVWHGAMVGYDAVTNTIIKLRKALNDDARQPRIIATIPKKGYQLIAPVSFEDLQLSEQGAENTALLNQEKPRDWINLPGSLIVVTVTVLLSLLWLWPMLSSESIPAPETSLPSIVILPFENLSNDPSQEYLADGMTEDIITDLSGLSNLMVIASNTSSTYKNKTLSSEKVANDLGVKYILKGSVRPLGETIRINTQLINAKTGFNVWAKRYDRKLKEVFAIQDEVTQNIVNSLTIKMSSQEKIRLGKRATDSLKAYDFFQEGQRLIMLRTKEGNKLAREAYQKAIELDPAYGRAYGAIAVSLDNDIFGGYSDEPVAMMDKALFLANKAVELSDSTPQTHWALAFTHMIRREHQQAEQVIEQAIKIFPNYAEGFGLLALIKMYKGEADEALKLNNKAMRLHPYYGWQYLYIEGGAHFSKSNFSTAIDILEKAQLRNESVVQIKIFLAASYAHSNQQKDAEWMVDEITSLSSSSKISELSKTIPITDTGFKKLLFDGLRKASLPE